MIKTLTYIHLKSSWLCISHHFILYEKEGQSSRAYRREQRYMFIYKYLQDSDAMIALFPLLSDSVQTPITVSAHWRL